MAKQKKEETGLVLANFTQADVPSFLTKVNEQLKALRGEREKITRIDVPLGPFGKVSTITDVNTLRAAYAYVTKKIAAVAEFDHVFKSLHSLVQLDTYKEGGYSVGQWQQEIIAQFQSITFEDKIQRLEVVKAELEKNLSAEHKLTASLQTISDILQLN